jgi:hypothetical protein
MYDQLVNQSVNRMILSQEEVERLREAGKKVEGVEEFTPQQLKVMLSRADVIFNAGSRWGGKTWTGQRWIISGNPDRPNFDSNGNPLWVNQSYCFHPKFQAAVIRKNEQDLEEWVDGLIPLVKALGGHPLKNPWRFEFDSGAFIYLGHFESEKSWEAFQGKNLIRLLIEEGGQMDSLRKFELLRSAVRSVYPEMKAQTLMNANPIGPGLPWLYDFFIEPKDPKTGELLRNPLTGEPYKPEEEIVTKVDIKNLPPSLQQVYKGKEDTLQYTRVWIPSNIADNPHALNDPSYITTLATMEDEKTVRSFLFGDWKAFQGTYFSGFAPAIHVKKPEEFPLLPWWPRWGSLDIGYTHRSAVYGGCQNPVTQQTFVYKELSVTEMDPEDLGYEMAHLFLPELRQFGTFTFWVSHDIVSHKSGRFTQGDMLVKGFQRVVGPNGVYFPEQAIKTLKENYSREGRIWTEEVESLISKNTRSGYNLRIAPKDRVPGWNLIRAGFRTKPLFDYVGQPDLAMALEINAQSGADAMESYLRLYKRNNEILPKLLISTSCPALIAAIPRAVHDPTNPEDVIRKHFEGADNLDSLRYFMTGGREQMSMSEPFESRRHRLVEQTRAAHPEYGLQEISWIAAQFTASQSKSSSARPRLRLSLHRRPRP